MQLSSLTFSPADFSVLDHSVELSYQVFGQPIGTAPVILINHALTGNSQVTGENGWWKELIGTNKTIQPEKYTLLVFNVIGNGFDGKKENLITNYTAFTTKIIAEIFWKALEKLNIHQLYSVIGGSIGGAIAWEMAFLKPKNIEVLIPIATNYRSSDWLIGNVYVQDAILRNSRQPIEDARMHAMLLYRCPEGLNQKFNQQFNENEAVYQVESWLKHHGHVLNKRFELSSYKLMNHLLKTIGQSQTENDLIAWSKEFKGKVHLISVDSDMMFTAKEQKHTFELVRQHLPTIQYSEIKSVHGHDAFLIEFEQMDQLIKKYF